jgi:hypothetical protein
MNWFVEGGNLCPSFPAAPTILDSSPLNKFEMEVLFIKKNKGLKVHCLVSKIWIPGVELFF